MSRRNKTVQTDSDMTEEPVFTKSQLMCSNKYAPYKFILMTYLDDDGTYTIAQVDNVVNRLMRK